MFGFGDNLIVEFPGVSWLLWLHLLVMIFLVILLSYLGIFALDVADSQAGVTAADRECRKEKLVKNKATNCSQENKVREDQTAIKDHLTTTARSTRRKRKEEEEEEEEEDIQETGETSTEEVQPRTLLQYSYNPCYYLEQVVRPFLKCLGLDSTASYSSSTTKQGT